MRRSEKINILLVDDKSSNLLALEEMLDKPDRLFTKALTGEEALKLALKKDFDLIILDVQMPGMDGFEVVKVLKTSRRTREIPIIFASAEKKEQKWILKGIEEGAYDYLSKPLDPEITAAKVDLLLKMQAQKRELMEKNQALEKYALLINNCSDLICTIDPANLMFEEINQAFVDILGYSFQEIRSNSLLFLLVDEDRKKVGAFQNMNDGNLDFETRIYCKSREIKWLHWHIVVKDKKWFANARDITQQKQVEEIKSYLSTVVKQSTDAIYLHDLEGKIISWNKGAEDMYGYKEYDALQMKIWNIIPAHLLEESQNMISQLIAGNGIPNQESKRITRHGKIIDVIFSASLVFNSNSELRSIAITERDITEQKISDTKIKDLNEELQKNLEQLECTNKELEAFSYSVSHDLRAPLRAIAGYSSIISEECSAVLNEDAKRLFGNIDANAKRMGTLIDDLLEFSRLGRKSIKKTEIEMDTLVRHSIKETNIRIDHPMTMNISVLPPSKADYNLMNQVWINLISNAIKYSSKKKSPRIEIGGYKENGEVIYFVKDNGAGFNMKYADKLFGVFQRLHTNAEFEGTGVGLAIVKRIISKHGGRIWADSKINEGTTFFFSIPE